MNAVITDRFGNTAWTGPEGEAQEALAKLQSQYAQMQFKIDGATEMNRPPNPPAGFVNNNALPAPPAPQMPGTSLPQPKPPTPAVGMARPHSSHASKEPVPEVTHILLAGAGWIPFKADTLNARAEDLLSLEPDTFIMFMDRENNQINCRASAVLGLKTKYRAPK